MSTQDLCAHCQYRPVKHRPQGGGSPARFCSEKCRTAYNGNLHHRQVGALLNQLRSQLGLPERGQALTVAELRHIIAVLGQRLELPDTRTGRGSRRVWAPHGTQKRYKQGCHEACCRAAETAYRRDLRARRKVDPMHPYPPVIHCQSDTTPLATPQADRQPWDNPNRQTAA